MNDFRLGQLIPGWCGGVFPIETMGQSLRIEALADDWMVLRTEDGRPLFWNGQVQMNIDGFTYLEMLVEGEEARLRGEVQDG